MRPLLLCLSAAVALNGEGCATAPPGMTGWLKFDEPMFRAKSPHAPDVIPGKVGSALRFDGNGQFFELPPGTKGWDPGTGDFSVELWVRTTETRTLNIVDKRSHDPWGWVIFVWKGELHFQVPTPAGHDNTVHRAAGPNPRYKIADGKWHHVAGVARRLPPGKFQVYVDGVLRGESLQNTTLRNITVAAPMWLARHHANAEAETDEKYFPGGIDEMSFYTRALAPSEIQAIYRAGSQGKCSPSAK